MIEVRNLTKSFGRHTAVDDVSFTVGKGEILGFLGPNGAGKSTTMRMITGFIPPTGGAVAIGGEDIVDRPVAARKKIGYLPENAPVYPDMTVWDYLDFCAAIRGFSGTERKRRVADTIARCFLDGVEYQTIGTLSKGYRQRVCFAQSILHDPEYLIMDEPTDGLDPNQKFEVRQMIQKMSENKAIILSTHILDEVDAVCTRAIIISRGRIIADDTPAGLRSRSPVHGAISLALQTGDSDAALSETRRIPGVKSAEIIEKSDGKLRLRIYPVLSDGSLTGDVLSALTRHRYSVQSVFVEQGRLDDVFRAVTAG